MSTPDDTKRRRGKAPQAHEMRETTCRDCACFRERTKTEDEIAWGECWHDPPDMREVEDDAGATDFIPVVRVVFLPYRCYSGFKPVEH
jgi:hypothetical protein